MAYPEIDIALASGHPAAGCGGRRCRSDGALRHPATTPMLSTWKLPAIAVTPAGTRPPSCASMARLSPRRFKRTALAAQPAGALAAVVQGGRPGLGRAGRRLAVQRYRPAVRCRRGRPGHCASAPEAGRTLAGQRHAWCVCSIWMCPASMPYYLCWRTGTMDRWECNAFAEWLVKVVN